MILHKDDKLIYDEKLYIVLDANEECSIIGKVISIKDHKFIPDYTNLTMNVHTSHTTNEYELCTAFAHEFLLKNKNIGPIRIFDVQGHWSGDMIINTTDVNGMKISDDDLINMIDYQSLLVKYKQRLFNLANSLFPNASCINTDLEYGFYNGLELALSLIDNRDPHFKNSSHHDASCSLKTLNNNDDDIIYFLRYYLHESEHAVFAPFYSSESDQKNIKEAAATMKEKCNKDEPEKMPNEKHHTVMDKDYLINTKGEGFKVISADDKNFITVKVEARIDSRGTEIRCIEPVEPKMYPNKFDYDTYSDGYFTLVTRTELLGSLLKIKVVDDSKETATDFMQTVTDLVTKNIAKTLNNVAVSDIAKSSIVLYKYDVTEGEYLYNIEENRGYQVKSVDKDCFTLNRVKVIHDKHIKNGIPYPTYSLTIDDSYPIITYSLVLPLGDHNADLSRLHLNRISEHELTVYLINLDIDNDDKKSTSFSNYGKYRYEDVINALGDHTIAFRASWMTQTQHCGYVYLTNQSTVKTCDLRATCGYVVNHNRPNSSNDVCIKSHIDKYNAVGPIITVGWIPSDEDIAATDWVLKSI